MIERRIAYYTRKVAEFGAYRSHKPVPPWYKGRHARLMAYKKRMHEIIERERRRSSFEWICAEGGERNA